MFTFTSIAAAACLKASSVPEVETRLGEAEVAWSALDATGFDRALDEAALLLPCLTEIAPPAFAARYHRTVALRAWGDGDVERASWSMLAARTLDPAYVFPDDLLAPDHELRVAFAGLAAEPGPTRHPPRPVGGRLYVDGDSAGRLPTDRSALAQLQDHDGALQTRMLRPGEPLPAYRAVPRVRNGVLVGSAVVAATGLGFYGAAWAANSRFWSPDTDPTDLERVARTSRTWTGLSAGCVSAAAVSAVVALVAAR
jgi:hypothetical protein